MDADISSSSQFHDELPARLIALQIYQEGFFSKKWRHVAGALYEGSTYGRARLELYTSEADFMLRKNAKIILLDELSAVRVVDLNDDATRHVKLQQRDGSSISLKAENVFALRTQLSRVAFPTQFVALTSRPFSSVDSPTDIPSSSTSIAPEFIEVLLLHPISVLSEGSYIIRFNEDILSLWRDGESIESFEYEKIHWIATGDYCVGFESDKSLLYEFKCTHPQQIIDEFRRRCRFRNVFSRANRSTVNHYLRFYYPDILRSAESTLSSQSKEISPESTSSTSSMNFHESMARALTNPTDPDIPDPSKVGNISFAQVVVDDKPKNKSSKVVAFLKEMSPFKKSQSSGSTQSANHEFNHTLTKNSNTSAGTNTKSLLTTHKRSSRDRTMIDVVAFNPASRAPPRVQFAEPVIHGPPLRQYIPRPEIPQGEVYDAIPLGVAKSPIDPSIQTMVAHLAPASRSSLASAAPVADAARVSRVEILQSTYID